MLLDGWLDWWPHKECVQCIPPSSHLNSDSSAKGTQTWKDIPELPVTLAAPLSIRGSLLAVGGQDKGKFVSAVHLYQPDAGQWVKVADMPTSRQNTTCTMITNNELLVAGGHYNGSELPTTYIAQVL